MPELYDGTRFPFCLSFELPALASPDEDSDSLARAKMHLRGYLRRKCGLSSFRDSDLEIDRLTAVWRIALFERDGFEITRANGEPGRRATASGALSFCSIEVSSSRSEPGRGGSASGSLSVE